MTTTAADLIARTQNRLLSGTREPRNKLAATCAYLDHTVTFQYALGGIKQGAAIYVDLEGMYVWEVNEQNLTATVERGQFGTAIVTHDIQSVVYVNPRFPSFDVLAELNTELDDLSSPANGLYQMLAVEIPFSAGAGAYDLTGVTNVGGVYAIEAKFTGLSGDWQRVEGRVDRAQDTTDFPSGYALHVWNAQPGQNVRVIYKAPFSPLTDLTDDVQAVAGLPATANDIPVLGAAARLMGPRESKRSFGESQGEPRRAEETPTGGARQAAAELWQERQRRIAAEASRLAQQYPTRKTL